MMVKAMMTVPFLYLVMPLAITATAMRIRETADHSGQRMSRAVAALRIRCSDVDSITPRFGL